MCVVMGIYNYLKITSLRNWWFKVNFPQLQPVPSIILFFSATMGILFIDVIVLTYYLIFILLWIVRSQYCVCSSWTYMYHYIVWEKNWTWTVCTLFLLANCLCSVLANCLFFLLASCVYFVFTNCLFSVLSNCLYFVVANCLSYILANFLYSVLANCLY